jgi:hypothetical protein
MTASRAAACLLLGAVALASFECAGGDRTTPTSPAPPSTGVVPPGPASPPPVIIPSISQVFVGAGDIGWCGVPAPEQTAKLLDTIGGTVFAAGDNAYFSGTAQEYRDCYEPNWGRHKSRTRPVPGNHEYESAGAAPYYDYFGLAAGPAGLGYYSFALGDDWHAIALNSNISVSSGSAQAEWLRADLAANRTRCTVAYWHFPLFTSGPNGDQNQMRDIWRILYDADVDVIVNGHDHLYERFAPQDPNGFPDPARGMREFIVGTGGAPLYNFVKVRANSERQISAHGVLKLTLQGGSYQWDFIPVSGAGDAGTGTCH